MGKIQTKLDAAQNAIIKATKRKLGERIAGFATAFIERYGAAFDLRTFLQTARTPLLVALPVNRQKIFDAATSAFINAQWVHVNEKDRYRIVLKPALMLDCGATPATAAEVPQIVTQRINTLANLTVTRRARVQVESFRRYNKAVSPAAQGAVAAGPVAAFSSTEADILDMALLDGDPDKALRNPFDTLQPNEQFTLDFNNITGQDAAGAFNSDIYATLVGMAIDIVTG